MNTHSKSIRTIVFLTLLLKTVLIYPAQQLNKPTRNAGVLPYAIDRINNIAYFLLGLENKNKSWTWTDFGGICDKQDSDTVQCAAREAAEETRGVFRQTAIQGPPSKLKLITKNSPELKQSIEYFKNAISKTEAKAKAKGLTASFRIFDKNYQQYFAEVDLINVDTTHTISALHYELLEKTRFAWCDVKDILNAVDKKNLYIEAFAVQNDSYLNPILSQTLKKSEVRNFINQVILAELNPPAPNLEYLHTALTNLTASLNNLRAIFWQ